MLRFLDHPVIYIYKGKVLCVSLIYSEELLKEGRCPC